MDPTEAELKEAADHVCYEVDQLAALPTALQRAQATNDPATPNACLESLLLHTRNLIEFLIEPRRPDDIHRSDFAPKWAPSKSAAKRRLVRDRPILDQHVSHLSWQRVRAGKQYYDWVGLPEAALELFDQFVSHLRENDPARSAYFEMNLTLAQLRLGKSK